MGDDDNVRSSKSSNGSSRGASSQVSILEDAPTVSARFRRGRIAAGVIVVVGAIAATMIVLHGTGVTIETFRARDKDDAARKELLDRYNSISGSLGLLMSKPVELFVTMFVSVALLCLATDFTLDTGAASHWRYVAVFAVAALGYLFSNGLNALNVQIVDGLVQPRIAAEDLSAASSALVDQPLFRNGSLSTTWDQSFAESAHGNPLLNTILRTSLVPTERVAPQCDTADFTYVSRPQVTFGFRQRDWQLGALPTALQPEATLKIPIRMKDVLSELPQNAMLPMPTATARTLVIHGLITLADVVPGTGEGNFPIQSLPPVDLDDATLTRKYGLPRSQDKPTRESTREFANISHALWWAAFNATQNVTLGTASVEYSRTRLSDSVTFDAVTLELSFPADEQGYWIDDLLYACGTDGCRLDLERRPIPEILPYVQAASIGVNEQGDEIAIGVCKTPHGQSPRFGSSDIATAKDCTRTSNSSMLVVSVARRIEGETWDSDFPHPTVNIRNPRMTYSITIGRLWWQPENLTRVFGAECGSADGCQGLRFAMPSGDQLVVGTSHLPLDMLVPMVLYTRAYTDLHSLVALSPSRQHNSEIVYDLLLPRRFSNVTPTSHNFRGATGVECNRLIDSYIKNVEKNHLYMEQSLQTGYAAAFFFLFQNAVRHKAVPNVTVVALSTAPSTSTAAIKTLAFTGNVQTMNVQVSIPLVNAAVSLVACALLLLASVAVLARASRSEYLLKQRAGAEIVATAVLSTDKFPPHLLTMALAVSPRQDTITSSASGAASAAAAAPPATGSTQSVGTSESNVIPLADLQVYSVGLRRIATDGDDSKLASTAVYHIGSEPQAEQP